NGRNVWNLATTAPGVIAAPQSDIGLSFRGAGQREIQNSLSLDGINSSSNLLAATSMRPIADAVTEIQVQTGSTSAEYGSYLGVHINVVTKSGTNDLHGSLFHFQQDESLDARNYFDNPALPKNPRSSKQFGAELDGPLVIPGVYNGHNRTFFMVAYEGVRGQAITSPIASVPTALMRQGNFSEISTPIRNPATGEPFPDNVNPLNALIPIVAVTQPRTNKNWLFGYTHTLRPNLYNDFRIGYHHIDFDTLNQFAVNGQADAGTSLGIPGFNGDTKFGNPGIPSVNVSNFTGIGAGGTNWNQFDTTFQVSN